MSISDVVFQRELTLGADEFIDVLNRSTLAGRRPVDDAERIQDMLQNANLIVTARIDGKLVGVSRALTDFAFCTYLSDLAVDQAYQKMGIGVRLIAETKIHSPKAKLILLAAPAAVNYYPKTGMTNFTHCFLLDDVNNLKLKE
ncbi:MULTISPECIES: GNAT family N-acetyltransferase [unclassified Mucilaginibacter]|uniref:GNAT family N-acetyltransferase n=1 Tax=unclassified Mucilaginibacter TaxID=2617802 RepID=UPI002AC8FCFD|nr:MULTISPECIES: GNAT family N-acetyltransferase [unclassified Mucilaginibacter]MEB0261388.1 GNAT family N-acetyltransferase [Mucilaginibacter sp. 10I4]MEB0278853.1 GNAT family N-acetyltransferase [Mucilaginibacter sp. 10B2]MEB0299781.1 GNAT family N-acetyltransferase [Mucilaginibacter sp. 5C4]WPX22035.1 GNAT family N-acetyltransferase [Mucilaginibacter sp. 5C4]